jgi:hypothetical protein
LANTEIIWRKNKKEKFIPVLTVNKKRGLKKNRDSVKMRDGYIQKTQIINCHFRGLDSVIPFTFSK